MTITAHVLKRQTPICPLAVYRMFPGHHSLDTQAANFTVYTLPGGDICFVGYISRADGW